MVLFISIVLNSQKIVRYLRYRLVKIATNVRTSRAIFKELATKELAISTFINIYNYYINGVDNAD